MGAILLILVILNSFATGWLLSQVKGLKRTVSGVSKVQRDISMRDYYSDSDEYGED